MDIRQGFSKQLTKINVKTSAFLEENKIKTYITTLENEIRDLKFQAGNLGYSKWTAKENAWDEQIAIFQQIAQRYQIIQEQEKMMQDVVRQGQQVLGSAGSTVRQAVAFCPNCGERFDRPLKFCTKCGTKLG